MSGFRQAGATVCEENYYELPLDGQWAWSPLKEP